MQFTNARRRQFAARTAITVALGLAAAGCGHRAEWARSDRPGVHISPLAELPERLEDDGTTITVGDPTAGTVIRLHEDPRCPYCKEFELTGGASVVDEFARQRKVKIQYTLASFLDDRVGGQGSKKAVNALRAALEEGKFEEYHNILYSYQPEEEIDGFTDARLLELASKVPGLRGTRFDSAVKTMKYKAFVTAAQASYESDGAPGTPTMRIDQRPLPEAIANVVYDKELTESLLESVVKHAGS